MTPQINEVFESLYSEYAQRVPEEEREFANKIKDLIERVANSLNLSETMRPDAKLYLLVNYHNLLVTPVIQSESMGEETLFEALEEDTKLALHRAQKQADWNDEETISGHRMLSTINEVWSKSALLGGDIREAYALYAEGDPMRFWPHR